MILAVFISGQLVIAAITIWYIKEVIMGYYDDILDRIIKILILIFSLSVWGFFTEKIINTIWG